MTHHAILITVKGEITPITWDDNDHYEHIREALSGVPAPVEGADFGWGCVFGRDPYIHGQGAVNVLATYVSQFWSDKGRVYSYGDVVLCTSRQDSEGNPTPNPILEFVYGQLMINGDPPLLKRMKRDLARDDATRASIKKLEDVRPDSEKHKVPE